MTWLLNKVIMKDKKFFCVEPFVSLSIIKEDHIFPCCLNEGQKSKNKQDLWNDQYLKNIREQILNDEVPKECFPCVEQEKFGRVSRRQHANTTWLKEHGDFESIIENDAPYKLDFWTGNLCNLACSTCNYMNSSTWFSLLKKAHKKEELDLFYGGNYVNNLDYAYEYKKEDIPNIDFKNIEMLHFNGGEPLLTDSHLQILNLIPTERRKSVNVLYNTNGTVRVNPDDEKWSIFKEFRSVDMCFSVDGIDETFNYVRWPAKWEEVQHNIDLWAEWCYNDTGDYHFEMSVNMVKTPHNYESFDNAVEYVTNRWFTKLVELRQHFGYNINDYVFTTNDHAFIDFTNEQFAEYTKTEKFKQEKINLERLRSL